MRASTPCRTVGSASHGRRVAANGSQGNGAGRENAGRERIWFSPHCLRQPGLF